ncbi:MAG: iron-containing alcohol dehydrogenase [Proteobacteria bacterium]|nr:iron-containing alcohol dehydrogenase [Pseudomonadota bacterium]
MSPRSSSTSGRSRWCPRNWRRSASRALVATDKGIVACGLLARLTAVLPADTAPTIFDATPANPTEAAVLAALSRYREAMG